MSLESRFEQRIEKRVSRLGYKVEQLEHAFNENNKILEETHGVVTLVLNEQREKYRRIDERFDRQEAFNQTVNENFKQLELLIRQLHPNH